MPSKAGLLARGVTYYARGSTFPPRLDIIGSKLCILALGQRCGGLRQGMHDRNIGRNRDSNRNRQLQKEQEQTKRKSTVTREGLKQRRQAQATSNKTAACAYGPQALLSGPRHACGRHGSRRRRSCGSGQGGGAGGPRLRCATVARCRQPARWRGRALGALGCRLAAL